MSQIGGWTHPPQKLFSPGSTEFTMSSHACLSQTPLETAPSPLKAGHQADAQASAGFTIMPALFAGFDTSPSKPCYSGPSDLRGRLSSPCGRPLRKRRPRRAAPDSVPDPGSREGRSAAEGRGRPRSECRCDRRRHASARALARRAARARRSLKKSRGFRVLGPRACLRGLRPLGGSRSVRSRSPLRARRAAPPKCPHARPAGLSRIEHGQINPRL